MKDPTENFGRQDEFAIMMAGDMTLQEAVDYHSMQGWGFGKSEGVIHDGAHILLGLALHMNAQSGAPSDMSFNAYQGNYEAEMYVHEIQYMMICLAQGHDDIATEEEYAAEVEDYYYRVAGKENLNRALAYMISEGTEQSAAQLREQQKWHDMALHSAAKDMGIEVDIDLSSRVVTDWSVNQAMQNGQSRSFHFSLSGQSHLPDNMADDVDFTRFTPPSQDQISAIYNRVRPVLSLIKNDLDIPFNDEVDHHKMVSDFEQALGQMKIADLYEAMTVPYCEQKLHENASFEL